MSSSSSSSSSSPLKVSDLSVEKQARYYGFAMQMSSFMEDKQYQGVLDIAKEVFLQSLFKDVLIEQLLIGPWKEGFSDELLNKTGFVSTSEGGSE